MLVVVGWALIAALFAIDCAWLVFERLPFTPGGLLPFLVILIPIAVLAKRKRPELAFAMNGFALNIASIPALTIFSYVCATADLPLRDAWLATMDHQLGINWPALYNLVASYRPLLVMCAFFYFFPFSGESVALLLLLPIISPRRNVEFALTVMFSTVICILIAMVLPAEGAIFYFGLKTDPLLHKLLIAGLQTFTSLRDGKVTDLATLNSGIVAFPSFHACAAVIYTYAVRGPRWLFRIIAVVNAYMLITLPFIGGHYVVDIIGGLLIGAAVIAGVRQLDITAQSTVTTAAAFAPTIE